MGKEWVGTGYSGETNVRYPNKRLRRAFIMLQRYPKIPESGHFADGDFSTDQGYEDWWGYLRYEPGDDDPPIDAPDYGEPLTVEPDERVPLRPKRGWPGRPLRLEVILGRRRSRGFEALVREYFESDG